MGVYDGIRGLPDHFFRSLCGNEACRTPLGGMHFPCDGGFVVFGCSVCGAVTLFTNTKNGFVSQVLGYSNKIPRVDVASRKQH